MQATQPMAKLYSQQVAPETLGLEDDKKAYFSGAKILVFRFG